MRIIFDTNIVLDVLASREPYDADARKIIKLIAGDIEGFITANTITDIHYVSRKAIGDNASRDAIRNLFEVFTVLDLKASDCKAALDLTFSDYEDCVLLACAKRAHIDFVISRDEKLISYDSPIPVLTPPVFLGEYLEGLPA